MEVEVAVWRGVCRIRGVHERAYLLTCVRTDAMVGHVACDELLHLNMEKTLEYLQGNLYRFERVKDQHARGARGAGARC